MNNREEVIKGLECCTRGVDADGTPPCDECPYDWCNIVGGDDVRQRTGSCQYWLRVDALAVFRELTEENERIAHESECHRQTVIDNLRESLEYINEETERVRADTIREMQERIRGHYKQICYPFDDVVVPARWVEQIAREMLEEDNKNGR